MAEEIEMVHKSGAPKITVPKQDRKRWEADGFTVVKPAPVSDDETKKE